MSETAGHIFAAALREMGVVRLRLDQIVTAYHRCFPHDAGHPDMRQRLYRVIEELIQSGVVAIPHGDGPMSGDSFDLPQALELLD